MGSVDPPAALLTCLEALRSTRVAVAMLSMVCGIALTDETAREEAGRRGELEAAYVTQHETRLSSFWP